MGDMEDSIKTTSSFYSIDMCNIFLYMYFNCYRKDFNVSLIVYKALEMVSNLKDIGKLGFFDSSSCSCIICVCFLVCFKEKIAQATLIQVNIKFSRVK